MRSIPVGNPVVDRFPLNGPDDLMRFGVIQGMENIDLPTGFVDPTQQWERFLQARRSDMRIQVVQRAINQGALAGMGSEITEYAAWLVIDALDSFDADAEQRSFAQGFRQGVLFERVRREEN